MVRIGRIVTFNGSRQTLSDKIQDAIALVTPVSPINYSFTDDTTMIIYGDSTDLTALKTFLENKGFEFVVNGAAPTEPVPDAPETPPDWDVSIAKQALINVILSKKVALDAEFQAEYTTLGGTNTPPNPEWKHYRWAL